jgi:hypothetical protein
MADKFARFSPILPNTVGAVDGLVFQIDMPSPKEVGGDVKSYYVRKGFYGYGIQAMADADCRLMLLQATILRLFTSLPFIPMF